MLYHERLVLGQEADLEDDGKGLAEWRKKEAILLKGLHPKQLDFVMDPGRRVSALVSRGGGKTTGVRTRLIRRMMNTPKARCLYVATTRDQAIDLMWNPIKDLIERLSINAHFNETSLRCRFPDNDSHLRLVGADDQRQIEKYRGMPHHEVWVDESASYKIRLLENFIDRIIGPRLGDFKGSMLGLVGTPGHVLLGRFYEATCPGSEFHRKYEDRDLPEYEDWNKWSFHHWTLEDGAPHVPALGRLWKEALVEKEAKGWSDTHPVWLREYMGQWAADDTDHVFSYRPHDEEGNELNQWNPDKDKFGVAILPSRFSDWQYVLGMDHGSIDPTAMGLYAYSPTDPGRVLYHVYEFEKRGMYAMTLSHFLRGDDDNALGGLFAHIGGYPESMVADAPPVLIDELSHKYGVKFQKAEKRHENRVNIIELANGDLLGGRIKILKGSRLEEQLMTLQWAHDDFGEKKKDKGVRDDQADQFIYARHAAHHLMSKEAPAAAPFFPEKNDPMAYKLPDKPSGGEEFEDLLSDGSYEDDSSLWD